MGFWSTLVAMSVAHAVLDMIERSIAGPKDPV